MKRVVIEGLVAFILLVWSVCNYIFFDSDNNLELKAFYPITAGAIIQASATIFIAIFSF